MIILNYSIMYIYIERDIHMYLVHVVEVEIAGLPTSDFASLATIKGQSCAMGWRWVTWQQSLDVLHQEIQEMELQKAAKSEALSGSLEAVQACLEELDRTGLSEAFRERLTKLSQGLDQEDMYVCIYVYIYIYMYTYIGYTYIHTYICIYIYIYV